MFTVQSKIVELTLAPLLTGLTNLGKFLLSSTMTGYLSKLFFHVFLCVGGTYGGFFINKTTNQKPNRDLFHIIYSTTCFE